MAVPINYRFKADLLKFTQKTKTRFEEVIKSEIQNLESVKTQFALNVRFSSTRNGERQEMEHYFRQRDLAIFNRNSIITVNDVFRSFIDEVKGEIEAWSQLKRLWMGN